MGDPRRLRKKYNSPRNPFEKERIAEEMQYIGKYGLRNKEELWRHKYHLTHLRELTRKIRALSEEQEKAQFGILRDSLVKKGLVIKDAQPDDILGLPLDAILDRRLQSQVFKLGLARTIYQARQLVTHGHIAVQGSVIDSPAYLIEKSDEGQIDYASNSPFKLDNKKIWGEGEPKPVESKNEEHEETE